MQKYKNTASYENLLAKSLADNRKVRTFASAIKHWSLRLSVRTRDFHSLKSSSTLLGTTNKNKRRNKDGKSQIIIEENPSGQG